MPSILAAMPSTVSSLRASSLKEGSPIMPVPPPISAMGRCPVLCIQCSIMICIRCPTWSEGAVGSYPIYPVTIPLAKALSNPSGSEI